jgi:prepilin-type N-terminal cleavage/methylation domain-containing protein
MARRRRLNRGFTLVELMISLVMGLIVSLAAVALARTATTAFHESARSSITEMSVRTGSERLRQDLMRVSYMMTGNIVWDPRVAKIVNTGATSRVRVSPQFDALQGLRIMVGGSKTLDGANNLAGTLNVSAKNFVDPDAIYIMGNMSTDDAYAGQITTAAVCSGNGQIVRLDPAADAAVYGLLGGDAGSSTQKNLEAAFVPVPGRMFFAQIIDSVGCAHYAPVCAVSVDANNIISVSLLDVNGQRPVLYSHTAAGDAERAGLEGNCGSAENGPVVISPIQRIRWQLKTAVGNAAADPNLEPADHKFDLIRQLVDYDGNDAGPAETVAEYAVDLKFGITSVHGGANLLSNPAAVPAEVVNEMDLNGPQITAATQAALTTNNLAGATNVGPQHTRAIRFRLATRGSMLDREADVLVGPTARSAANPYMSRYCLENAPLATCRKWARVRTVVSEVTLQNQARMFFP